MIRLVTLSTTPYERLRTIRHIVGMILTRSGSSIIDTIRNAHSFAGMTSGCFRYNRSSVRAAFFRTKFWDVLTHSLRRGIRNKV